MGIYILCVNYKATQHFNAIFDGNINTNESKFNKWLHSTLVKVGLDGSLTVNPKEFGSHSLRKGSATLASSTPAGN